MGSGKSSVGQYMARRCDTAFIDLDSYIESAENLTIPEIFSQKGEQYFRNCETDALKEIIDRDNSCYPLTVLALGGGTLTTPCNAVLIKEKTHCIYLKAGIETIAKNLRNGVSNRPMLHGYIDSEENLRRRIGQLLSERESIYSQCAETNVVTDGKDIAGIASEIIDYISANLARDFR